MKPYYQRLYKYNEWANEKLLTLIETSGTNDREVFVALSHYLAAQEIWISRIEGRSARVGGVWEVYDLARCKELAAQTAASWNEKLAVMEEAGYFNIIAYKNTQGNYYETPVVDIVCHCVNHATYHRAQIARMLRALGVTPVNTDFITYARLESLPYQSF